MSLVVNILFDGHQLTVDGFEFVQDPVISAVLHQHIPNGSSQSDGIEEQLDVVGDN